MGTAPFISRLSSTDEHLKAVGPRRARAGRQREQPPPLARRRRRRRRTAERAADPVTARSLVTGSSEGLPSLFDAPLGGGCRAAPQRRRERGGGGGRSRRRRRSGWWRSWRRRRRSRAAPPSSARSRRGASAARAKSVGLRGARVRGLPPLQLSTCAANARVRRDGHHAHHVALVAGQAPTRGRRRRLSWVPARADGVKGFPTGPNAAPSAGPSNGGSAAASPSKASEAKLIPLTKAAQPASMLRLPPPPPMSPKAACLRALVGHGAPRRASRPPRPRAARRRRRAARPSPPRSRRTTRSKAVELHARSGSLERRRASRTSAPSGCSSEVDPCLLALVGGGGRASWPPSPSGSRPSLIACSRPLFGRLAQPAPPSNCRRDGASSSSAGRRRQDEAPRRDDDESLPSTSLDDAFIDS